MTEFDWWSGRLIGLGPIWRAVTLGLLLGLLAGGLGLGVVLVGPVYVFAALFGVLVGLYILTDIEVSFYAILVVIGLIPFGTLPFKIGLTPTLLDVTLGAFLLVYVFQWMTGRRRLFQMTPVHVLFAAFGLVLVFSFIMGLRHAPLTPNVLRQFAEILLSIATALVLTDVIRDEETLRRVLMMVMLISGVTALLGIFLYVLPDVTAESILVRLARFGYPNGGVIRYVEDNPYLAERAIGVWVDPNAYGGVLAILGALIAPQMFAARPLGGRRSLIAAILGVLLIAMLLTFSRGALASFAAALTFIAVMRYRKLLWVMTVVGLLILLLPVTQSYVIRFVEGIQGADLATQMRFGEIRDSLTLIGRYPFFGVGFSGTPTRDIYLGVANLYLTMASNTGLIGLGAFLTSIAGFFVYGMRAWRRLGRPARFESIWLGTYAGVVAALAAGVFDHYFFKLEFQASGTLFWLVIGLALAVSRFWLDAETTQELAA